MKTFTIIAGILYALTTTAVGLAGTAAAAPTGGSSAGDVVKSLEAQGYSVQINGSATVPLSQCLVTGVHGDAVKKDPTQFSTVYVDVSCPPSNN
jgi:hypothetical protein